MFIVSATTKRRIKAVFAPLLRVGLKNEGFSIFSNNCWGGVVYDWFGRKYLSPTIGLYFNAINYIRFLSNLPYYLSLEPQPDEASDDLYKVYNHDQLMKAHIGDVHFVFVHYMTFGEAIEKWNRRKSRINFSNLLIKFSDVVFNGDPSFSESVIEQFSRIPGHKVFFTSNLEWVNRYEFAVYRPPISSDNMDVKESIKAFPLSKIKRLLNSIANANN